MEDRFDSETMAVIEAARELVRGYVETGAFDLTDLTEQVLKLSVALEKFDEAARKY